MRAVLEALIALSASPNGFTASHVAARVWRTHQAKPITVRSRHAAYDLKKLRARTSSPIGHTRRYGLPTVSGDDGAPRPGATKPSNPCSLRSATPPEAGPHNPNPIDLHYAAIQTAMRGVFMNSGSPPDHRQSFCGASPRTPNHGIGSCTFSCHLRGAVRRIVISFPRLLDQPLEGDRSARPRKSSR